MSDQPHPRLTPEQYLELDRASEFRQEYYDGRMYAMSGGSQRHAVIIVNLSSELRAALKKGPCLVSSSDLRVLVEPGGMYAYPDVVVACEERRYSDTRTDVLLNPRVIIEVLSPTTEGYDRGLKSSRYRSIPSLKEYALVSPSEPRVEIFRRQAPGDWLLSESIGFDASCTFSSIECSVPLSEIYDKVAFDSEEG